MAGHEEAARRQIRVTETVGILRAAAKLGLLELRDALGRLRGTNVRIEKEFLDRLIQEEKE